MRCPTLLAALLAASVLPAAPAGAAELVLPQEPYRYTVLDQDLRLALREFGANMNLRITLSDAVQGRVRGRLPELPPREFLSWLSTQYGFDWYYDGYAVNVTALSEGVTKIISLSGITFPQLKATLDTLGLSDPRYLVQPHQSPELVLVAGPPRFVELTEQAAALLMQRASREPQPAGAPAAPGAAPPLRAGGVLRVFRGADERRLELNGD